MTLFKNKKKNQPALYFTLDRKLRHARRKSQTSFYYPLDDHEVDIAMAWGIRNRVGIEVSHVTDDKTYYKFYGYSFDIKQKLVYNKEKGEMNSA